MKLNKKIFLLFTVFVPQFSFAFFCPTNFNQINFGDTLDQVTQQCGQPNKQETKEQEPNGPQEWTYLVPQSVMMNANQMGQGTLKMTIDFDKDGNAQNISVNGVGVGATTLCGGQPMGGIPPAAQSSNSQASIQLGQNQKTIKASCGEPSFIYKQQTLGEQPRKKVITTFNYDSTPPQKLTFEDGKLTNKE